MNAAGRKAVSLTSVFILLAFVFLFTTAYYAAVPLICFAVLLAVSAASGFLPGRRLEYTVESEGRSEKEKPLVFFRHSKKQRSAACFLSQYNSCAPQ